MRKEAASLAALILLALLIRGLMLSRVEVVLPDEAYFIRMGQHLAEGKAFKDFDWVKREFKGQPSFPYLYAWACRIGKDPLRACQWTSVLLAVLTLIPFHFCVRMLSPPIEAFWADLVYVLSPFTVQYSVWAMPHSLFNFFWVTALWFTLKTERRERALWALLAGVAAWGAYMTRVEGIVFAAVLILTGIFLRWLRFHLAIIFLSTFVILSFPFWIWLKKETGMWQLTWSEGLGASGIYVDFIMKIIRGSMDQGTLPQKVPLALLFFYLKNLRGIYFLLPKIFPHFLWIAVVVGMIEILRGRRVERGSMGIVLLFAIFPFFFYPLLESVEARFLSPAVNSLSILAGAGIHFFIEKGRPFMRGKSQFLLLALLLLSFAPGYHSLLWSFKEEPLEMRRMGEWIERHFKTPQVLFGSDSRACFYAGGSCKRFVSMRRAVESLKQEDPIESFLVREKVDLVLLDTRYIPKFYPSFKFLLENPPQRWTPLIEFSEEGNKVASYHPELIFS